MSVFERIKQLANKRGKSMQQVAEENGFSSNLFYRWKKSDPKAKDIARVADYFHVSTDYLLGRDTISDDPIDLDEILDDVRSFDGKPLDNHDRELIRAYLKGLYDQK